MRSAPCHSQGVLSKSTRAASLLAKHEHSPMLSTPCRWHSARENALGVFLDLPPVFHGIGGTFKKGKSHGKAEAEAWKT